MSSVVVVKQSDPHRLRAVVLSRNPIIRDSASPRQQQDQYSSPGLQVVCVSRAGFDPFESNLVADSYLSSFQGTGSLRRATSLNSADEKRDRLIATHGRCEQTEHGALQAIGGGGRHFRSVAAADLVLLLLMLHARRHGALLGERALGDAAAAGHGDPAGERRGAGARAPADEARATRCRCRRAPAFQPRRRRYRFALKVFVCFQMVAKEKLA